MAIKLNKTAICKAVVKRALEKATPLVEEWSKSMSLVAPIGPTGNLKKSFSVQQTSNKLRIITKDQQYGPPQTDKPYTHVPKGLVGVQGWQHFGRRLRPNIDPEGSLSVLQRNQKWYWIGLKWARKRGFVRYLWDYRTIAWIKIGGELNFRRTLETGNATLEY